MRIAIAGSGRLAAGVMARLLRSSHEVVAVVEDGRRSSGLGRTVGPFLSALLSPGLTPGAMAKLRGIPVFYLNRMDGDELAPLARLAPDLLLVAGFGIILKRPVLDLPRVGCVNCHSSLLPRHRGPNPFQAVILAGERESGVTFHAMTEGIDDGSIIAQFAFDLHGRDTAGSVYERSAAVLQDRVLEVMDGIEANGIRGRPQRAEEACYDRKLTDLELALDWSRPARDLDRLVRAGHPFTPARFGHRGRTVYVWGAEYSDEPVDESPGVVVSSLPRVVVATGHGTFCIEQAFTRSPCPWIWPSFTRRPRPGDRLG